MSPAATTSFNNNEMSNNRDENQRQRQQQQQQQQYFQQQQAITPPSFYPDEQQQQQQYQARGLNSMMNYPSASAPTFLNQAEHPNAGYSSQMDPFHTNMNRFNHYSPQQLQQQQFQIQQQQQQQLFYNPYLQDQQQQQQQPQYYQPPVPVQPPAQLQQFNGEAETELDEFILDLLTKPQQRLFLLKTELEFEAFIKDERQLRLDFPPMNSYQRLMIHKLAPYYQLNHYHDPLRKGVYVCKTFTTEMPKIRLPEVNTEGGEPKGEEQETTTPPQFKIMRRSTGSSPNSRPSNQDQKADRKNLTFEERKTAYEEARARIFQDMEQKKQSDSDSQ